MMTILEMQILVIQSSVDLWVWGKKIFLPLVCRMKSLIFGSIYKLKFKYKRQQKLEFKL